jgi:exonuclease SbcC
LRVEGFGAFRAPTAVSFDDVEIFALVGPTGSGKSTLIDAICFALYGTVPRYADRRTVAPVVTAGALEAKVSLTFELGGRRYVATRVVRRDKKGGASTKEARLEEVGGDVLAGMPKEIDAAVERLLGLTFEHFTRAVVLPQGEFARFLHDKPADRQDLLVKLLGFDVYGRMMVRARLVAAETEKELEVARRRIEELAGCTEEEVAAWDAWAGAYAELRGDLRTARDELRRLDEAAAAAGERARRAREVARRLEAIRVPKEFSARAKEREQARTAVEQAEAALDVAAREVGAVQAELEGLGERDPLLEARRAHQELAALDDGVAKARKALDAATTALGKAVADHETAERELEARRAEHAAHVLVGTLAIGEPCPVCDHPVEQVPRRAAPKRLDATRRAVETARNREHDARDRAARAEQALTDLGRRRDALVKVLAVWPDAVAVEEQLARHQALAERLDATRKREAAARREVKSARDAEVVVDRRARDLVATFRTQRDGLVEVGAAPPEEHGDLAVDWPALEQWAGAAAPRHVVEAEAAEAEALRSARESADRLGALASRAREELELTVPDPCAIDDLLDLVSEAEQHARAETKRIGAGLEERRRLEADVAATGERGQVAAALARYLDARNFERWLVAEALDRLVTGASDRLRELSGGQYSFAFEESSRDLLVVDHTYADERRSVRTLSGGETFQASLALALALADQLGELAVDGASRLESIFLDEGFGSLDVDTLETVAETIEGLGAGARMVGVVTHVPDLASRMPVQYRVSKHGDTATVEQVAR